VIKNVERDLGDSLEVLTIIYTEDTTYREVISKPKAPTNTLQHDINRTNRRYNKTELLN
jgi:hypothetical protein